MLMRYISILISLMVISACNKSEISQPIASVGGVILTRAELVSEIPPMSSAEDSTIVADEYIHRWITQQVMLQKAELNLNDDDLDVERNVEEYRRALLVERYQQKLVDQKFNPVVSDADIEAYYNEMRKSFKLNEAIMKGVMAVVPKDAPDIKSLVKWLQFSKDEDYSNVEKYLFNFSHNYVISTDKWIKLSSVKNFIPTDKQPSDQSLYRGRVFECKDDNNVYLISVQQIISADEYAPIEYVHDKINLILVNKQKIEFIRKLSSELYNEALKNNMIKYYTNE